MAVDLEGEEALLKNSPNERVVHVILELQRERGDLSMQANLHQKGLIDGDLNVILHF